MTNAHSHLLYTPQRVDALRSRIASDAAVAARWQRLRRRADELLNLEWIAESDAARGPGQHADYARPAHAFAELVETLGLVYRVEGNPACADKIRQGLLYYTQYQHWCAPSFYRRLTPWHSELVTGYFSYAYGLGYDILRDQLTPAQRETILAALVEKGLKPIFGDWLLPDRRVHALDSMGHNWWIVCLSFAGIAALSICDDHPQARSWIDALEQSIPLWFDYRGNLLQNKVANFDSAGAFYESLGYANFALREYLLYRLAFADARPGQSPASHPLLSQLEPFFLHSLYPTSKGFLTVNFGDHAITDSGASAMRLLAANGMASPAGQWYAHRASTQGDHPHALLFDCDAPMPALPTSALFPGVSWAILRSSWDNDATLLAIRAGTFWCHAHADSASFVLFHRGQPLIIDAGKCDYARPEYRDYYVGSAAHNVVLVDGQGAPRETFLRGSKFPGQLHNLFDDAGIKYICADATGPLAHLVSRHYRHFLWLDGVVVIFDDLLAHAPASFNWLLHHAGTAKLTGQSVLLANGDASASIDLLYPPDLSIRQPSAPAPDNPNAQATYLEFTTPAKSQQQNFIALIRPDHAPATTAPTVEMIQGPDLLGLRITSAHTITEIYFNLLADGRRMHDNSNATIAGWETDACLLAITRNADAAPESFSRLLMINGSYLRRDGTLFIDSLSKLDILHIPDANEPRLTVHGQPTIDLRLRQTTPPHHVTFNGTGVTFHYSAKECLLRISITRP